MHRFHYFIISACMLFTSCNKDEVITEEVGGQPIIELDSETGIYTVKVDHELTIAPTYQNVEDALFAWFLRVRLFNVHGMNAGIFMSN